MTNPFSQCEPISPQLSLILVFFIMPVMLICYYVFKIKPNG